MTYEKEIMDLYLSDAQKQKVIFNSSLEGAAYLQGHRDARHAAAEIAMKADQEIQKKDQRIEKLEKRIEKLVNALERAVYWLNLHFATEGYVDKILAELKEAD